jgi:hypothetical protein
MRPVFALGITLATTAAGLAAPSSALACGGCFGPSETVQVVTDHRMVMAVHPDESILWDQIRYTGDPADFSWVLPVSGDVRIELATNEFFEVLDQISAPQIRAPFVNLTCPGNVYDGTASPPAAADAGTTGGVTVLHEEVVGPYQTVTLRSTDANALETWLASNAYVIPPTVQPIIQYYVDRHMDFVALRLRPGEGVRSMQPIRIRFATANMVLPLRMVAAGIADHVGISLWIFANGRYEAANFANGTIDPDRLVWNWSTNTSNYADVFDGTLNGLAEGRAWITEFAQDATPYQYSFRYVYGAMDPTAVEADWNLATHDSTSGIWITRLRTDLVARYLDTDLQLQASAWPTPVSNTLQVPPGNEIGTRPTPQCGPSGRAQPVGTTGGNTAIPPIETGGTGHATRVAGCSTSPRSSESSSRSIAALGFAALLAGIYGTRRRRSRSHT